ncbi:MAG: response regulator [Gammaproteobacteria bacterium]
MPERFNHEVRLDAYAISRSPAGPGSLRRAPGYSAALAALAEQRFDAVLTDLRMEMIDGIQVLRRTHELHPETAVIVITGYATISSAVDAMKEGAFHYITKPFRLDELRHMVREAVELSRLRRENRQLISGSTRMAVTQAGKPKQSRGSAQNDTGHIANAGPLSVCFRGHSGVRRQRSRTRIRCSSSRTHRRTCSAIRRRRRSG